MNNYLYLFLILFALGTFGFVMRSGLVSKVMSLGIFTSSALVFVINHTSRNGSVDGSIYGYFVVLMLGVQVIVCMSLAIVANKEIKKKQER